MSGLLADVDGIRENLTQYVASFCPDVVDIFDTFKIYDRIKDLDDNDLLFLVVERFCDLAIDLSPASISNAEMGDIYEELILTRSPSPGISTSTCLAFRRRHPRRDP